jgi:hypothetical protein
MIEKEKRLILNNLIDECNNESGLNIQTCYDEPTAFNTFMANYGKFDNVKNYIAIVGKKGMDEKVGYYGEKIVLKAQELGLNTCWVALTFSKNNVRKLCENKKLLLVISFGIVFAVYGGNIGTFDPNRDTWLVDTGKIKCEFLEGCMYPSAFQKKGYYYPDFSLLDELQTPAGKYYLKDERWADIKIIF